MCRDLRGCKYFVKCKVSPDLNYYLYYHLNNLNFHAYVLYLFTRFKITNKN